MNVFLLRRVRVGGVALCLLWSRLVMAGDDYMRLYETALGSIQSGNIEQAETQLQSAIEANPAYAPSHFQLGVLLIHKQELLAAEAELQKALSIEPGHSGAALYLGVLYRNTGDRVRARQFLQRALQSDPLNWRARYTLASFELEGQEMNAAEEHFRHLTGVEAFLAPSYRGLGEIENARGHYREAEQALRKAIFLDPEDWRSHYLMGVVLHSSSRYLQALEELQMALQLQPGNLEVLMAKANVHMERKEFDLAEKDYLEVLSKDSKSIGPHLMLGELYSEQRKDAQAIEHLDKVLAEQPRRADASYLLGVLYLRQGNLPRAEELLKNATESDPAMPKAHYNLANVYLRAGKTELGKLEMETFQRLSTKAADPNAPP